MRHGSWVRSIAAVIVVCAVGLPGQAMADDLGGVAAIRAWATAAPLRDPVTVSAHLSAQGWTLPGSRVFRYLNAAAGPIGGPYAQFGQEVWTARGLYGFGALWWSIATSTNSRRITLGVSAGQGQAYRVRVDGSPSSIQRFPGPGWRSYDITIRLPDSRWHTVVLQMAGFGSGFAGAATPVQGRLARPRLAVGPRTIFLGDSWTAGDPLTVPFESYVERTAELLGLGDAWASGIGGTGYVANAGTSVNFAQRLQSDVLRWHPGTVIVAGGGNDLSVPPATLRRSVTSLFARIREALPHVRLIAVGPWSPFGVVPGFTRTTNIIRRAVVAQHGAFIDTTRWITGHNAGRYIGLTKHPNVAGYRYVGTRLAAAIRALPRNTGR
jgi:lysophospholipase L1-like esterase